MDSNTVQIIGLSEIEGSLNLGEDYQIQIQGTCNQISKTDNEDGSVTYKHKIKQKIAKITSSDGRQVIVKDTKSQSTRLRAQHMILSEQQGKNAQVEYDLFMVKLRHFLPEVIDFLNKLE